MFPCFSADLTSVFSLCGGQWHSGCVQMMVQISWNQWTQPQFIFFLPEGEKPAAETHRGVLDSRHSDTCWSNICIELFSLLSSFIFCSIKVISCKLNTSLLSYWLNEAQLKKVTFCRLTRGFLFLSPQKCSEYELNFTQKASNTHVWSWYYKSFRILSFVSHWRGIRCNLSESNRPHPV